MGKRVHVAKRYEVEYGGTEAFNWCDDKFYDLLNTLGAEPNNCGAPDDSIADVFECPVNDYDDALKNLACYIADPALFEDSDTLKEQLLELNVTADWLLQTMKSYREEADTRDGYLHFASF